MIGHNSELVLAATIHRVKLCEEKIKEFEQIVTTLTSQMAQNRAELASKGLERFVMGVTTPLDIPKELVPTFGAGRARRNRTYASVKKRWTIWKHQVNSGITIPEIAKAWGVHPSSIIHARSKNFETKKLKGESK